MHDILREIVSKRKMRIESIKAGYTREERLEIHRCALDQKRRLRISFGQALEYSKSSRAVIAEFKRASPSKGDINIGANPAEQAVKYEKSGAACISVLTEPDYFKGSLIDLQAIAKSTALPILCKDFIVDKIQIDFAKLSGADAILLIAAVLNQADMEELYKYARLLELDVLVEAHNQLEMIKALKLKDAIIGINNRNLKTFRTDISTTERLTALIPAGRLVVSESGIETSEDMDRLKESGVHAFLVGETLMRKGDEAFIRAFVGAPEEPKIKICGLTRASDVRVANQLGIDYAGFVFAKSRRQVSPEEAKILISELSSNIRTVGVFVDRPKEDVQRIAQVCGLDIVQLHGSESAMGYDLDRQVWKSVSVKDDEELKLLEDQGASGVVYDTFSPAQAGGTGKQFAWKKALPGEGVIRIAAGGLDAGNVEQCISILAPDVVDISSGVETEGVKDPEKMRQFVRSVRKLREG